MSVAKHGDTVKVHYTGRLKDGTQFDSSEGNDPLEFDLGAGQVIEGFEEAIIGMKEGDKKTVEIPVDKAYGPINEDYILKAPRNRLPQDLEPFIGLQLLMPVPDSDPVPVTVTEFNDEEITLDANHQLAGKDLIFDLELVGVLSM
jgi:peptidylprolyl isomerase